MKKTYMIPRLNTTLIGCEALIAESYGIQNKEVDMDAMVKGDNSSRSDYNVWNDDWSK